MLVEGGVFRFAAPHISGRCRLQVRERLIGPDAGRVAHTPLFDEHALTSRQPHPARDELGE